MDIFFLDWERPRGQASDPSQKGAEAPVSIWRTYFIANEWNEIQTTRKINHLFQIFAVVFFLHVVGLENITTADPRSDFHHHEGEYYAPYSKIFRFAVSGLVFVLCGRTFIYI